MITSQQYKDAATRLRCEPEAIRAVDQVEAPGGGFDSHGTLVILFEPHIFYKELRRAGIDPDPLVKQYPRLVSPVWNPNLYGGHSEQWGKLTQAMKIHKEAAEKSASYGRYQIMGQNYKAAGYDSVDLMLTDYQKGEDRQLNSFVTYILKNQLDDELRSHDWASFARQYNGPSYWKNQYDTKIRKAYENAKKLGV
jgi:hypothetical protein